MSVTNIAFVLAFVTTPIDSAHSMLALCIQALCFLLMCITSNNYGLIKVVNNANGTRLAGGYPQTGMRSPIESECKIPIFT